MPSNLVKQDGERNGGNEGSTDIMTAKEHLSIRLAATYGFGIQDDPEKD